MTLRLGELCAGYGGLGMAVEEVFDAETAWFSEFDAAPSKILAHHWPAVPNYGDMTKIDWAAIEPVDIISGGTPCQDLSGAGKRAGMTEGTRSNLWVQMREAIAIQRPKYVVWENVRGAFSAKAASDLEHCPRCMGEAGHGGPDLRALGRVLGDLSDLGFDAEWRGVRASEVGACHARFRVFVLAANRDNPGRGKHGRAIPVQTEHSPAKYAGLDAVSAYQLGYQRGWEAREAAPNTNGRDDAGRIEDAKWRQERREAAAGGSGGTDATANSRSAALGEHARGSLAEKAGQESSHRSGDSDGEWPAGNRWEAETVSDAMRVGSGGRAEGPTQAGGNHAALGSDSGGINWGAYGPAIQRWERAVGRAAPRPTEPTGRAGAERLSPRFTEWMMGLPGGWVTDPAIGISRNEQLKACGNGVVPQQAAAALRDMLGALEATASEAA